MPASATLKARLTLDKSLFDRGIASAQAGATSLANGLLSISRVGVQAFKWIGIAAVGLGAALAVGTKKAFDLGGSLADLSAISGRSVRDILLLRRGLQDAGVSMEKIDRFILTGKDKGNVIARALQNMSPQDWADAAASVGKQADILQQNSKTFDRVSDLLGRSGDKLQGFFVGVADRVSSTLLPILERFDKADFASVGQKFGDGLVKGAQALVGFFNNPALLFDTATNYFRASILGIGNVLIAVFKTGLEFFKNGFENIINSIGSAITATLMESGQKGLAYIQAGIEVAKDPGANKDFIGVQIKAREKMRDAIGVNMSGDLNFVGKAYQKDIDELKKKQASAPSFNDFYNRIINNGGPTLDGRTAAQWREQAKEEANKGISGLTNAARGFKVTDVLGAGAAMTSANQGLNVAAAQGRSRMPSMPMPMSAGSSLKFTKDPMWKFADFGAVPERFSNFSSATATTSLLAGKDRFGNATMAQSGLRSGGLSGGAYKDSPYAYGQTGNIWAPGSSLNPTSRTKDPAEESANHLKEISDALVPVLKGQGGAGGDE